MARFPHTSGRVVYTVPPVQFLLGDRRDRALRRRLERIAIVLQAEYEARPPIPSAPPFISSSS